MYVVLFRTILLYILIIFSLRVMGKRQLGELQPSEFVITILISNIAPLPIEDTNVPLLCGAIPILTLMCFEVFISTLILKSKTARKVISGNPRVLIRDGKVDQQEMQNLRFSVDDLLEQLRTNNVFDIQDVAFAIVETTGKLSVYQRFEARNVTPQMLNLQSPGEDALLPVAVISDGEVVEDSLRFCNLKPEWLHKVLSENGYQPVVIMAAMLGSSGVVLYGLTQVKDEMIASLDELTQMVEDKEYDRAHELSEQLFHRWDEEENRLIRYVRHTDLDSISSRMARLPYLVKYKDPAEFLSEVSQIRYLILHLWESELPLMRNIL